MSAYGKGIVEVLTEKTFTELNVNFLLLQEGSHQKIYVKCTRCKEEFTRERRHLKQLHACPVHIVRSDGVHLKWCNNCKMFLTHSCFSINNARTDKLASWCASCAKTSPSTQKHNQIRVHARKTDINYWFQSIVYAKQNLKKNQGIPTDIDADYLKQLWQDQDGICWYTGVKLQFATTKLDSAWLERLDPKLGYVKGNLVWASKAANCMKNDASLEEFSEFLRQADFSHRFKVRVEYQLLSPLAKPLTRERSTDAGLDISSVEDIVLKPNTITPVKTGICIACPEGHYYTIEGRSGLYKKGIMPSRGIIDAGFLDQIFVLLHNVSSEPYEVKTGDRIAQIIMHQLIEVDLVKVTDFSADYNLRGKNSFGSSGR